MAVQTGIKAPFGICEVKPIVGALPGRMKIRMRNKGFVRVYFKTENAIRCFIPEDKGDYWQINHELEQGRNERRAPHTPQEIYSAGVPTRVTMQDRKSTRLNSSHVSESRMPSSA